LWFFSAFNSSMITFDLNLVCFFYNAGRSPKIL
jgi:hypothetical protein